LEQTVFLVLLALAIVAGFVLYPKLMINATLGLLRGLGNLLADAIALIFAF